MIKKLIDIAKNILQRLIRGKEVSQGDISKYLEILPFADKRLIKKIKKAKLTYLSNNKLASLAYACRNIEKNNIDGIIIEAGCALGGSSILLASLKSKNRYLNVYDVFGMIPPPTDNDTQDVHDRYNTVVQGESIGLGGDEYYGYQENLYETVQANFRDFGVNLKTQSVLLVRGLVQDTLIIDQPVALAHIDVDWYDPVMTCLERIFPNLVVGGSIIIDDYYDWGGCKKATDDFLTKNRGRFILDDSAGSLKIIKQ